MQQLSERRKDRHAFVERWPWADELRVAYRAIYRPARARLGRIRARVLEKIRAPSS